jgi:uncharacterized paraquat-inducible protein A
MKEKVGLAIAGMFAIALVVFFALHMIPLEVFGPIVTGALVWIFKDVEQRRMLKIFKENGVLK